MVREAQGTMRRLAARCAVQPVMVASYLLAAFMGVAHAAGPGYLVPAPAKDDVQSKPKYECDTPDAPVITLETQSKYKQDDTQRATIDEDAEETYTEAVEPLRIYGRNLVKIANAYVKSNPKNTAAAACALTWLDAWASANAMSDMRSKQAQFNLSRALSGFALAYLQIRDAPNLSTDQKRKVESWLRTLGQQLVGPMDKNDGTSGRNNHRYWAGLGAAAAGVASGDKQLARWGFDSSRIGLGQITPDGALPLELKRGKRARDYHIFAADPLVTTAELARSQGIDLYAEHNGALERLVKRVIASLDDPTFFEKATGTKQEAYPGDGTVPSSRIAWLEIYQSRRPSPAAETVLSKKRPTSSTEIGGNTTLLFYDAE
ncbi:alginate lyase family protein [Microvirga terrestris]|uniref:Alginate lyase family protein n=1 Tax=Microvirga terrestris TaxID=2791024 RepID=A0ABS0HWA3_9HYPH|nr:alginate lyase family protein [Microvirga terrestris]MBF9197788.1 alginate lyase family protein [Microvirga terrestris]